MIRPDMRMINQWEYIYIMAYYEAIRILISVVCFIIQIKIWSYSLFWSSTVGILHTSYVHTFFSYQNLGKDITLKSGIKSGNISINNIPCDK